MWRLDRSCEHGVGGGRGADPGDVGGAPQVEAGPSVDERDSRVVKPEGGRVHQRGDTVDLKCIGQI